jgi:DNA-binding GntR family transcriptional regulator
MADGLNYVPFKPALGLVERIALHIEHQIVAGVLRSGDRIHESGIVTQLDVSRGSVRESFRVLERRRLIDVIPRKGAIVTSLSPSRVRDLTSVLPPFLTKVVADLIPNWSDQSSHAIHRAMQISEGKFGCVNPLSVLELLCQLHPNPVYLELIDDLIPTFDRVFSKLVRSNLAGVESLDQLLKLKLIPALEAGEREQVFDHVTELCRMLERKYLETLERTG